MAVKGHGGVKPSIGTRTNRARATQYQTPASGSKKSGGASGPLKATNPSPNINLKGASAQQRDPNVYQTYQKGRNPSSVPASKATVKKTTARQNRGS